MHKKQKMFNYSELLNIILIYFHDDRIYYFKIRSCILWKSMVYFKRAKELPTKSKTKRGFKMKTYILENISDGGLHYEKAKTLELAFKQAKLYTKSKLQLFKAGL